MSWILVGVVAGSILTSGHETREACEGRVFTLKEQKIAATCVPSPTLYSLTGITIGPQWQSLPSNK